MDLDSQHGFRSLLDLEACFTSLLDFFAQVIDTYDSDNNKAVDLVYLDFQKAFDKVPHERLMARSVHMASKVMPPDGS